MRPELWTGLVVVAAAFTVRSLQARSLANEAGLRRVQGSRRLVRDTASSSPVPSSTSFSSNSPPLMSSLPFILQSPSSPASTPPSTSPLFSSSLTPTSNVPSSISSLSPLSSMSSSPTPSSSPSAPSPTFTSAASPSSPSPSSRLSSPSSSPQSSPATLPLFSSRSSLNTSLPSSLAPQPSSPYPSSQPQTLPPVPTSPSFQIPPSPSLPFALQSQLPPSISSTLLLLSSSFQLLSESFQLLSSSFQLLSQSYQLPVSPVQLHLPAISASPCNVSSTVSPVTSEGSSGLRGHRSLIGLQLECDDAAKYCLTFGRLVHEPTGKCYRLGDAKPCGYGYSLVLDADALANGRLRTVCRRQDPCDGVMMFFDGQCYNQREVRSKACNNSGLVVPYPTGQFQCMCVTPECLLETPPVQQPTTPGRCALPDLNRPPMAVFRLPCSAEAAGCLALNLFFEGKCYKPLTNTTCPEGQWLALDDRAGNLSAACVPQQPCGPGKQKLNADGQCHSEEEIRDKLCPDDSLNPLPNGNMHCSVGSFIMSGLEEDGMCLMGVEESGSSGSSGVINGPNRECGRNDDEECPPEVHSASLDFVISPEF